MRGYIGRLFGYIRVMYIHVMYIGAMYICAMYTVYSIRNTYAIYIGAMCNDQLCVVISVVVVVMAVCLGKDRAC